jgi:hypothetical protein
MWPKGTQLHWQRRDITRKKGFEYPHRPGFGQTPLKIFETPQGFYVGTGFIKSSGGEIPYTIESDYFKTRKKAEDILNKMTGKSQHENLLRSFIRAALYEQVVGYQTPQEKTQNAGGYLSMGDMGVDISLDDDSTDEEQASADQIKKLTKQRQQALDQGNTVDAENIGQQLGMARRIRG